jgi:hypothetical protein
MSKNFIKIYAFTYYAEPEDQPVFVRKDAITNVAAGSFRHPPQSYNTTHYTKVELLNGAGYNVLIPIEEFMNTYFPEEV